MLKVLISIIVTFLYSLFKKFIIKKQEEQIDIKIKEKQQEIETKKEEVKRSADEIIKDIDLYFKSKSTSIKDDDSK